MENLRPRVVTTPPRILEDRLLPSWRPSIFTDDGAYIAAELDYILNFTSIFTPLTGDHPADPDTSTNDYFYLLAQSWEGFGEYLRYRFPAAQGTVLTRGPVDVADVNTTPHHVDPTLPPLDRYSEVADRLMPRYSLLMMGQSADLAEWAILALAGRRLLLEKGVFMGILPASPADSAVLTLINTLYDQTQVIYPLFSYQPWVVAHQRNAELDPEPWLAHVAEFSLPVNSLFDQQIPVPAAPIAPNLTDQVALTTQWRIPGPLDLRYQVACPRIARRR